MQRPLHAIPHNALVDGKYYCFAHRYPPCQKCGKRRAKKGRIGLNHKIKKSETQQWFKDKYEGISFLRECVDAVDDEFEVLSFFATDTV